MFCVKCGVMSIENEVSYLKEQGGVSGGSCFGNVQAHDSCGLLGAEPRSRVSENRNRRSRSQERPRGYQRRLGCQR